MLRWPQINQSGVDSECSHPVAQERVMRPLQRRHLFMLCEEESGDLLIEEDEEEESLITCLCCPGDTNIDREIGW